jgi:sarcosine oxidase subunit alpha
VLATGSFDQPLVFANNDRPGILFADAAQRLMRLYGVVPGRTVVVATANHLGYEAALDCLDAGLSVAAIVDLATGRDHPAVAAARQRGIKIIEGSTLADSRGSKRVEGVAVARVTGEGKAAGAFEWLACDAALMSVGYTPALNLASHAGAKVVYDATLAMHRAVALPEGIALAGAVNGVWSAGGRHRRGPCRWPSRGGNAGTIRSACRHDHPSLSDLRGRSWQDLHRLRRGSVGQGHRERGQGRL